MENLKDIIKDILGKLNLKKTTFFGLEEQCITIFLSPTLKIYHLHSTPKRLLNNFPFEQKKIINLEELKTWSIDNKFVVTFSSPISDLNRKLLTVFGDGLVESISEKKNNVKLILLELNESNLPKSIKQWAAQNPEKFIKNIEHIKNLLKK